jgi:RNA polymerase sigma factor (sigma-70 family)
VQDALSRAFYAMSMLPEVPNLRPWLFRIAHNAALDHLKSHGHKYTDVTEDLDDAAYEDRPDPQIIRAAIGRFLSLSVTQRSAVILKDVLDHSLEETAETMGTTVLAVKAALVRARKNLRESTPESSELPKGALETLNQYAALFNARNWDGVRALIAEDCRLDLVSKSQRRGKEVGMYFDRYEKADVRVRIGKLDGEVVLAAYVGGGSVPAYFIVLEVATQGGERVTSIRDFRYVPYIATDARFEPM